MFVMQFALSDDRSVVLEKYTRLQWSYLQNRVLYALLNIH